jgi:hypothetical protein
MWLEKIEDQLPVQEPVLLFTACLREEETGMACSHIQ